MTLGGGTATSPATDREPETDLCYEPFDERFWRDPYPTYRRLRDEDPVHFVHRHGFFALSRFEDVFRAATDTATFSSASGLTFAEDEITKLGLAPTLVMMDRPQHVLYRRLVNKTFMPREVEKLESSLRAFVRTRIENVAEARTADWVSEVAGPVPSFVVAHYLGVPESDRSAFGRWSDAIVQANASGDMLGAPDAVKELYGYFTDLIAWRRSDAADDIVSALIGTRIDSRPVSVEEILGFCFVMVAGGNDTASGLLSESAAVLTDFPDERRALVRDRASIRPAVDELLRFVSPVQGLSRTTTCEVVVHDTTIPPSAKVHLLYASANRDPREFGPDSEELRIGRHIPRMLAFSSGPHHCLGAAAARLEARVVLEELLALMPDFVADRNEGRYAPGAFTRRFDRLPIRSRP